MSLEISVWQDTRRAKRNGSYPLKLRLYYDGKTVLYPTVYNLTKEEFAKLGAKRVSDALSKLRQTLQEIKRHASDAAQNISPFDFEKFYVRFIYDNPHFQIRKKAVKKVTPQCSAPQELPDEWLKMFPILKEQHPGPDYLSVVYADIIKSMLFQARIGNASSFHSSYNSFKAFRGNIRFREVTPYYLLEYESWMINEKGNSKTTVGIYCRALRTVINDAIDRKLMSKDSYPFGRRKYGIPTGRNIKKAMQQETIAKLYYTNTEKRNQEMAKDFWFFCFYGNGMNVKDIINLKYQDLKGSFLTFTRAKTELTTRGREPIIISCYVSEDMRRIIDKWGNKDKNPENYIFPILSPGLTPIEQFRIKQNFTRFINKNMAKVSVNAKIERPAKTMEARHSLATILKNAGISPHFVKEALGHASLKTTENYLGGFEDEKKKEASDVINEFKAKYVDYSGQKELKNSELQKPLLEELEEKMDSLSPEQIDKLFTYINNILVENKADHKSHLQNSHTASENTMTKIKNSDIEPHTIQVR